MVIDYMRELSVVAPLTIVQVYRSVDEGEVDPGGSGGGVLLPHSRARRIAAVKNN